MAINFLDLELSRGGETFLCVCGGASRDKVTRKRGCPDCGQPMWEAEEGSVC